LSELDSGPPDTPLTAVSLSDVIEGAARAVELSAGLHAIAIKMEQIPDVQLLAHPIRLQQVFVNLLDNAVKFNKPNGEVHIEVRQAANSRVEIEIKDSGIGIPPDDLSRIFERFYRVDKGRSRQVGGSGLGLSIVKRVLEQMNGTISVESQLGHGS